LTGIDRNKYAPAYTYIGNGVTLVTVVTNIFMKYARSTRSITKSSLRAKIFYKNVIEKSLVNDIVDLVITNKKHETESSTSCQITLF
jgi:hypothetical protein